MNYTLKQIVSEAELSEVALNSRIDLMDTFIPITYLELQSLQQSSGLSPAAIYYITDRSIWVTALSASDLDIVGKKSQMCPTEYFANPTDGNQWQGIWPTIKLNAGTGDLALNDLCIWNGKVWKKITDDTNGGLVTPDLDAVNWELVDPTTFTNNEYTELFFGVHYDFVQDTVLLQWDKKGNYFVSSLEYCDWNNPNIYDNKVRHVYNNSYNDGNRIISGNTILNGNITNNTNCNIQDNTVLGSIWDNTGQSNGHGTISENTNKGDITGNIRIVSCYKNSNNGYIRTSTGTIMNNSNIGLIEHCSYAINNSNKGHLLGLAVGVGSGMFVWNTDKSSALTIEQLGDIYGSGGAAVSKVVHDQVYLSSTTTTPQETLIGDNVIIYLESAVFDGVLNLEISRQFRSTMYGSKQIQLIADGPVTVNQIIGIPFGNSIRFVSYGSTVTFTNDAGGGTYLIGGILNKLDYLGVAGDVVLSQFGDWVEYEAISYPNIYPSALSGPNSVPSNLQYTDTVYYVTREVNRGLYPAFPFETPLAARILYKSLGALNDPISETDVLAWVIAGEFTSDAPIGAFITWTDMLSNPHSYDLLLLPPGSITFSNSYSINGDDRAFDGTYHMYIESGLGQIIDQDF